MHNFEKRVVIHQDGVPNSDKYCLVMLEDGTMQKAFFDDKWILFDDYNPSIVNVKSWCYIEDLFKSPKNLDIRMYISLSVSA